MLTLIHFSHNTIKLSFGLVGSNVKGKFWTREQENRAVSANCNNVALNLQYVHTASHHDHIVFTFKFSDGGSRKASLLTYIYIEQCYIVNKVF